ncbi:hypothetical protein [Archangium minus]|uniref:hypothetical protein n=1 Tax=Archangium minus TaxID=83450 RepID=UPI0037BFC4AD
MQSEVFGSNPIGVDVDPRELLRRLRAGEPPAELAKAHSNAEPRGFETMPAEFFR